MEKSVYPRRIAAMIEWHIRHRASGRPAVNLGALTPAECEALALLAEGHTAKSIAALTGRSVAAVNERLREARRKTGIGSSRELARLLAAHKNRDEKIDLGSVPAAAAALLPQTGDNRRWWTGRIVMPFILIGGLAAALIAAQVEQKANADTHVPPEPLLLSVSPETLDEGALHEQLRREPRDTAWAEATEKVLRDSVSAIAHMNDLAPVRVLCATSLCEVANTLPEKRIGEIAYTKLLHEIQEGPQQVALQIHNGLQPMASRFGGVGANGGTLFVEYWSRGAWKAQADPMFGEALKPEERGVRALYTRIRSEVREPSWADPTEAGLLAALKEVPALQKGEHVFAAHCAVSLCEVSAVTAIDDHSPQLYWPQTYSIFMRELQGTNWAQSTERLGLKHQANGFVWVQPDVHRYLFFAYFSRTRS